MKISTITTKGQVLIPSKLRKRYGLKAGTKVTFLEKGEDVIIKPIDQEYFKKLIGITQTKGKALRSLMKDKKIEREL
jgi:AbrB family looped-hinge helix DNA binding protein